MADPTVLEKIERDVAATQARILDYKMVTFTLAGKDYGIDIMSVKEIAKFANFTYVPNTAPFVRGVYNLRGDIISIIDLRLMFNLPVPQKTADTAENGLILRTESNVVGVIVDSIDKVVSISSEAIQPPHPIFGDINIKYISGVVEHDDRLYIILDADRVFVKGAEKADPSRVPAEIVDPRANDRVFQPEQVHESDRVGDFIEQELFTLKGFTVSPVNRLWFLNRLQEWKTKYEGAQITDAEAAQEFLTTFTSRNRERLWPAAYLDSIRSSMKEPDGTLINVWAPDCGAGYEAYSIACAMKRAFVHKQIKVWASDTDLMRISSAPNLVFTQSEIAEEYDEWIVQGKNGPTCSNDFKEMILFEYSDALHSTSLPKMHAVVMRDVLSFLDEQQQNRFFSLLEEMIRPEGILILGDNEQPVDSASWVEVDDTNLTIFRKRA